MLNGKVVVVTGSTSGIGLAIAKCFGREHCKVVLHGSRPLERAQEAVDEVQVVSDEGAVSYCQASLVEAEAGAKIVIDHAVEKFGTVDILVNNAGIQHVSSVDEFSTENWDRVIAVNLTACFHTIRLSLPHMKASGWGRIINISSVHGLVASANKSAYVAAKHGLNGLSKVVALENAGNGITCNAVCPGWVHTPLVQKQIDAIAEQKGLSPEAAVADLLSAKEPTKQFTLCEDIGEMCLFLSSKAGANLTGAELPMDGAWSTQ
mmetsp:Transcript_3931/g.13918  ORF Transcript_3931/g.13918 Transcript_3931/m.13918 type:complete len:263 (+) Transcript_3931:38-826(+)